MTVAAWARMAIPLLLGTTGVVAVLVGRGRVRGTTLTGPWWWLLVSIVFVSAVEACAAVWTDWQGTAVLRLAAGCSTFCPVMSLLGAKRPQHRGWHFVVLSLWVVLVLPALQSLVLHPDYGTEIHGLRKAFLILLIGAGLVNGLPTRHWMSAILLASGQTVLLAGSLRFPTGDWTGAGTLGLGLFAAALIVRAIRSRARRDTSSPLDRLWLDFRDSYGLLWSLRVAEQVNAAAARYRWDLLLRWHGFCRADGSALAEPLSPETDQVLRQNLTNLLRRFVSPDWIADRLASRVH